MGEPACRPLAAIVTLGCKLNLADSAAVGRGLRAASFAKCESVGPLHKSHLKSRIGRLPAAAWADVENGLRRVLGVETAE